MSNAPSFSSKQLRVTMILGTDGATFDASGSNTIVLSGYRVIAQVQGTAASTPLADIQIYGMKASDMNALTQAWFMGQAVFKNQVVLEANSGSGWVQVFSGTMLEAQPEYRGMPDVYFRIQARVGYFQQMSMTAPTSYPGATQIASICFALAKRMGFQFENNGVKGSLASPYFAGTLYDQLVSVADAAKIDFYFHGDTLAICPRFGDRTGIPIVILNAQSGLIGYPSASRQGLEFQCLFNAALIMGGRVRVQSSLPFATGDFIAYSLTHSLESMRPGGAWTTAGMATRIAPPDNVVAGSGLQGAA